MNSRRPFASLFVLLLLGLLGGHPGAWAANLTLLHTFQEALVPHDGAHSQAALLRGTDGNFYGTTDYGGSNNSGTIFRTSPDGDITVLHSFQDGTVSQDGAFPCAGLIQGPDGNFYGTTVGGGSAGDGTVYKMTPDGVVTILHHFKDYSVANDGVSPTCGLILGADGNFYGTTRSGGNPSGGIVYRITPTGTLTVLHAFVPGKYGISPMGLVQSSDGALYGVTEVGTLYRISKTGGIQLVYAFQGTGDDTIKPASPIILGTDGNFYGTASTGVSQSGSIVYKLTPTGVVTILHVFSDGPALHEGRFPFQRLTQGTDGSLYGVAIAGGANGGGTVYRITPGGVFTVLHDFAPLQATISTQPLAPLCPAPDGSVYGATYYGGVMEAGIIYRIDSTGQFSELHEFQEPEIPFDGDTPQASLIKGADGNLYGTTSTGGFRSRPAFARGEGTIFKMTPAGDETVMHVFGDGTTANDGALPTGRLLLAADGNFYGTTKAGGAKSLGTAFRMTPAGVVTILHSFGDGSVPQDGTSPMGGLTQGRDGLFYGTTTSGGVFSARGTSGYGTVFCMTGTGVVTILHSFNRDAQEGSYPESGLIQAKDGNFYGTTRSGGTFSYGYGTAYKMTPAGVVTILHSFGDGSTPYDGLSPVAGLLQGSDGNFYGTTTVAGISILDMLTSVTARSSR